MTIEEIDYSPLEAMRHASFKIVNKTWHGVLWPVGILVFIIGMWVLIAAQVSFVLVFGLVGYFSVVGWLTRKYKANVWLHFAQANNWTTSPESQGESELPPSINFGHSHVFSSAINAVFESTNFLMFEYECTTGEGKSSQTHYFTVAKTTLQKNIPHIILRAKRHSADLTGDMENVEKLKLEGNFNDHFQLQIEKGQEVDALIIITPDVMQTLLDYSQSEDIEIIGNNLFFIVRGDKRDVEPVKQLIRSVAELSGQLRENARTFNATLTIISPTTAAAS